MQQRSYRVDEVTNRMDRLGIDVQNEMIKEVHVLSEKLRRERDAWFESVLASHYEPRACVVASCTWVDTRVAPPSKLARQHSERSRKRKARRAAARGTSKNTA